MKTTIRALGKALDIETTGSRISDRGTIAIDGYNYQMHSYHIDASGEVECPTGHVSWSFVRGLLKEGLERGENDSR